MLVHFCVIGLMAAIATSVHAADPVPEITVGTQEVGLSVGYLLLNQAGLGIALLISSVVCAFLLYKEQSRRGWGAEQDQRAARSQ